MDSPSLFGSNSHDDVPEIVEPLNRFSINYRSELHRRISELEMDLYQERRNSQLDRRINESRGSVSTFQNMKINHYVARLPRFSSYQSRIETFPENWDDLCSVPGEELARAGFIRIVHQTSKDSVACYYCGCGLHNWKQGDNPMEKHKKYQKRNCVFLRLIDDEELDPQPYSSTKTCVVCLDKEVSVVTLPCKHYVCCGECVTNLMTCPVCRSAIDASFKLFFA